MKEKRECSIEGCQNKYKGSGYCSKHYYRFKKNGDPNIVRKKQRGICSILGCGKPHSVKGYCFNHFMTYKNRGLIEGYSICSVIDCNFTTYCKGLCVNHYEVNRRTGSPDHKVYPSQCKVKNCSNPAPYSLGYCGHHYSRFKRGIPFEAGPYETYKGEGNPRWNGGTSEYPNHSLMKKIRLKVLEKANYICAECGGIADRIHHKDRSNDNHSEENFEPICAKCHCKFSIRYKKLYGYFGHELKEMGFLEDIILMQKSLKYEGYQPIENLMVLR